MIYVNIYFFTKLSFSDDIRQRLVLDFGGSASAPPPTAMRQISPSSNTATSASIPNSMGNSVLRDGGHTTQLYVFCFL